MAATALWRSGPWGPGYLAQVLLVGGLWFALDLWMLHYGPVAGDILLVYPTTGLAIGLLVRLGPNRWPGVLLGSVATAVWYTTSDWASAPETSAAWGLTATAAVVLGQVVSTWCAAVAIRLGSGGKPPLHTLSNTLWFLGVAGLFGPFLSLSISMPLSWAVGRFGGGTFGLAAYDWWAGEAVGNLVVAPWVIRWLTPKAWWHVRWRDAVLGCVLLTGLVGVGAFTFSENIRAWGLPPALGLALGLPLMAWLTVAYGQLGATASLMVGAVFAMWGAVRGRGPLAELEGRLLVEASDLSVVSLAVTLLLVGAVVSERLSQFRAIESQRTDLAEQRDRLRRLSRQIVDTEGRERRELATRLHDGIHQYLAVARLALQEAGPEHDPALKKVRDIINQAVVEGRAVINDLAPPTLTSLGLHAALSALVRRFESEFDLPVLYNGEPVAARPSAALEAFLFRATRELLFNAAKHDEVSRAGIEYTADGDVLELTVWDDGPGFDLDRVLHDHVQDDASFGLFSVREQVLAMGGGMRVNTEGKTRVTLRLAGYDREAKGVGAGAIATPPGKRGSHGA